MTHQELLVKLERAIAQMEGFVSSQPTLAQRNASPGNLRAWRDAKGLPYPTSGGYVDFVAGASERFPGAARDDMSRALEEGWRILRVLAGQYVDGRYTGGKPPTVEEMFRIPRRPRRGSRPLGRRSRRMRASQAPARRPAHLRYRSGRIRETSATIRQLAGHVSPKMLKHYTHIRMAAKRSAVEGLVSPKKAIPEAIPDEAPKESPKVNRAS